MTPFVYLASQSPRRRQLLEQWGLRCEALLPDPDEDAEALEVVRRGEAPARYVQRVTALKLQAARQRLARRGGPIAPILCADTTVACDGQILGKPADAEEAVQMLSRLQGRWHQVLTAVAVAGSDASGDGAALSRSEVHFVPMTEAQIRAYVATGEPMGKAGAYAIQGLASLWIDRIRGSHSGIMGLPAHETGRLLQRAGLLER